MSLRRSVLRGSTYLAGREVLGVAIRTAGLLLLTAAIGPTQYGLYIGPALVLPFLAVICATGTGILLVRRREALGDRAYHQVFTWILITTTTAAVVGISLLEVLQQTLLDSAFIPVAQVLLLGLPLNVLWTPAKARLEHSLEYKKLAYIEVAGDVVLYGVSLPLAFGGLGAWAPALGYLGWQSFLLVTSTIASGYFPRLLWDWGLLRPMLAEGASLSASSLSNRTLDLFPPIVVGGLLGPAALGLLSLTIRLLEALGFVRRATSGVALVALGRLREEPRRLGRALQEGVLLQVLSVGPLLAVIGGLLVELLPRVLGYEWAGVRDLFPLLGVYWLGLTLFSLHGPALIVLECRSVVLKASLARNLLLFSVGLAAVQTHGLLGVGIAYLASLLPLAWYYRAIRARLQVSLRSALAWVAIFAAPILAIDLGSPWRILSLALLPMALLVPLLRREVLAAAVTVRSALLNPGAG